MPLFLMGCFPVDFQEVKQLLRTKSVKRPIKVGKRPIKEAKRPIKAMVLVGISVGCLMGCFRAPPPWRKTAPLKRPIKRSMMCKEKASRPQERMSTPTVVTSSQRKSLHASFTTSTNHRHQAQIIAWGRSTQVLELYGTLEGQNLVLFKSLCDKRQIAGRPEIITF